MHPRVPCLALRAIPTIKIQSSAIAETVTKCFKNSRFRSLRTAVGTVLVGGDDVLVALGFQPLTNAERVLHAAQKLGVLRVLVRGEEHAQDLLGR